jgi:hypothetical protein
MLAIGLSWRQALPAIAVGHIIIAVVMVRPLPLCAIDLPLTTTLRGLGSQRHYWRAPSRPFSRP